MLCCLCELECRVSSHGFKNSSFPSNYCQFPRAINICLSRWSETKELKISIIDGVFSCHLIVMKLCTVIKRGTTFKQNLILLIISCVSYPASLCPGSLLLREYIELAVFRKVFGLCSGYEYRRRTWTLLGYEYVSLRRLRRSSFFILNIFDWQKPTCPVSVASTGDVLKPLFYEYEYVPSACSWKETGAFVGAEPWVWNKFEL